MLKVLWATVGQRVTLGVFATVGITATYLGVQQAIGNFHTVIVGELYRSAQPTSTAIQDYARRYGIRTVINLRGANPGRPWYDNEVATTQRLGLTHIDFRMSAKRELSQANAAKLLAIFEAVPKPILIHCQGGADRTGIATALYLAHIAGAGEERAEWQMSVIYGHIGIPLLSPAFAMDRAWEKLEPWLGFEGS